MWRLRGGRLPTLAGGLGGGIASPSPFGEAPPRALPTAASLAGGASSGAGRAPPGVSHSVDALDAPAEESVGGSSSVTAQSSVTIAAAPPLRLALRILVGTRGIFAGRSSDMSAMEFAARGVPRAATSPSSLTRRPMRGACTSAVPLATANWSERPWTFPAGDIPETTDHDERRRSSESAQSRPGRSLRTAPRAPARGRRRPGAIPWLDRLL